MPALGRLSSGWICALLRFETRHWDVALLLDDDRAVLLHEERIASLSAGSPGSVTDDEEGILPAPSCPRGNVDVFVACRRGLCIVLTNRSACEAVGNSITAEGSRGNTIGVGELASRHCTRGRRPNGVREAVGKAVRALNKVERASR